MPTASLDEFLRYIMVGFAALAYSYGWDLTAPVSAETLGSKVVAEIGVLGVGASSLAFGALFYTVYRAFLYDGPIKILQDLVRTREHPNYRTYFRRLFSANRVQAERFYSHLRGNVLADEFRSFGARAAGLHYVYMVGVLGWLFAVAAFLILKGSTLHWWYLLIGSLCFLAAFIQDRRFENSELVLMQGLGEETLREIYDEHCKAKTVPDNDKQVRQEDASA